MQHEILTTREVATLLNVERQTVIRYVKQGKLKAIRFMTADYRYFRSDIEKFLKGEN